MADFEIIEDIQKALPKGKLKSFLPFIIAGGVLGVIALVRRGNQPQQEVTVPDQEVGSGVDLGGIINDLQTQTNQAIKENNQLVLDQTNSQLSSIAGVLVDSLAGQKDMINSLKAEMNNQLNSQVSDLKGTVSGLTTNLQEVNKKIEANASGTSSPSAGSSIYFDGVDDGQQFQQIVSSIVANSKLTPEQKTQAKKEVAGLGNNGIGYDPKASAVTNQKLETDPAYRQAELERTQLVIENRKQAGMSTTAQENYLKQINQKSEMVKN